MVASFLRVPPAHQLKEEIVAVLKTSIKPNPRLLQRMCSISLILALFAGLTFGFNRPASAQGSTQRAEALVVVNSASGAYIHYIEWIQPYLEHFGIPYTTWDISVDPAPAFGEYAVIIIGHDQLDVFNTYLTPAIQGQISAAVYSGTGLVNFDYDLASSLDNPFYTYIQDIFNFTYYATDPASLISFNTGPALGGYITSLQTGGASYTLRNTIPHQGLTPAAGTSVLANLDMDPLLLATAYGSGRAVQWTSTNWISPANLGFVSGMDDLIWRSIVWAARKPFVLQGMPPLVTFRVDDVVGPFGWVQTAVQYGFKPWLGIFLDGVTDVPTLKSLVDSGNTTVSIHARSYTDFFYYDDAGQADLPAGVVAQNFTDGTNWHTQNQIPISKVVVPHYYEIGTNVFQGLADWGVEFVITPMTPGQPYGADRLAVAPFQLYATPCGSSCGLPIYLADELPVPGHPEFDGQFHVIMTEIRDLGGYEWYPSDDPGYLQDTIDRGVAQLKRALDGMELATIFTHEEFIQNITPENWTAILAGVTAGISSYAPEYVTLDDAARYVRAVLHSRITSSIYDSSTSTLTTALTGSTDTATRFYLFTESGGVIQSQLVSVPAFTTGTQVSTLISTSPPLTISGSAGVPGANISFTGGTPVTADSSGNYTLTVPYNWSGTVTPTLAGHVFSPASRSYTSLVSSQIDQNFTASTTTTRSIPLAVGWNLVSFNLHPISTLTADVLASVTGNFDLVYAWDSSVASNNWLHYDNIPMTPDTLTHLDETVGFWIHMTAADTLEITGTIPTTTAIPLRTTAGGWNLVGYPSLASRTLPAPLSPDSTLLYAYHPADSASPWKLYDRTAEPYANTLLSLTPDWGYWIYVTAPDTWSVAY